MMMLEHLFGMFENLLPCLRLLAVYESLNWLMVESLEQILMQQQMDLLSYQ